MERRVGVVAKFGIVRNLVAIGVDLTRVGPELQFLSVRNAVIVGVLAIRVSFGCPRCEMVAGVTTVVECSEELSRILLRLRVADGVFLVPLIVVCIMSVF